MACRQYQHINSPRSFPDAPIAISREEAEHIVHKPFPQKCYTFRIMPIDLTTQASYFTDDALFLERDERKV